MVYRKLSLCLLMIGAVAHADTSIDSLRVPSLFVTHKIQRILQPLIMLKQYIKVDDEDGINRVAHKYHTQIFLEYWRENIVEDKFIQAWVQRIYGKRLGQF